MTSPKPANTVFAVRVKGRPPGRERFNEIAEAEQAAEALAISSGSMVEIVDATTGGLVKQCDPPAA